MYTASSDLYFTQKKRKQLSNKRTEKNLWIFLADIGRQWGDVIHLQLLFLQVFGKLEQKP